MRFEWDPRKNRANRRKHGVSFEEASCLLEGRRDFLEIFDEAHSEREDRLIAIGWIQRGMIVVVYTEAPDDVIRILSARMATAKERRLFEEYWRKHHG